jgi:hypothetical protein
MPQNRSSAVMQQRSEARDSLDDFPTPPWATRALCEQVLRPLITTAFGTPRDQSVWEPFCNRGHMARPLAEHFRRVHTSDVHDYSYAPRRAVWPLGHPQALQPIVQDRVVDFLWPDSAGITLSAVPPHWIITNPPFRLAEQIVARALTLAWKGVAIFVRSAFLEGQERYESLFSKLPPTAVAYFAERVILHKGLLRDPAREYWDAARQAWVRPTTATAYCWLVWVKGAQRVPPIWIPPCRQQLTRPGDYPANADDRGVFTPPAAEGQGAML